MFTLLFCQEDLDQIVETWNSHRIRYTKNQRSPHGRPFVMYSSPEIYGTRSSLYPVNNTKLNLCEEECLKKSTIPCNDDVFQLSCSLMIANGWNFSNDPLDAIELYVNLRRLILNLL